MMSKSLMRYLTFLLTSLLAVQSIASDIVWSNINNVPGDLISTGDGWSATRAEDVGSYRIAADDVFLAQRTRITGIEYFSIQVGNPDILGGDLYVFSYDNGIPGTLIAAFPDLPLNHYDTGLLNTVFNSNVYGNIMPVIGLELAPGRYFFALRTVENRAGGAKNGILTTRTAIGTARAKWNFEVTRDGTVNLSWMDMSAFNSVQDQEWAFQVHGALVTEPSSFTVNLGKLTQGNLASLANDDGNALRVCRFIVPNQQVAPVTVQINGTASILSCSALKLTVKSHMVHAGLFSQTLDLFNWNTNDWDIADNRTDNVNTTYTTVDLNGTGNLSRLLRPSDGALRARYRVRQIGPAATYQWCHEVDQAVWIVTP